MNASRAMSTTQNLLTPSSAFLVSTAAPLASLTTYHLASPALKGITWPIALAKNAQTIARVAWRKNFALSVCLAISRIALSVIGRRSRHANHTKWSMVKSAAFLVCKDTKPQTT